MSLSCSWPHQTHLKHRSRADCLARQCHQHGQPPGSDYRLISFDDPAAVEGRDARSVITGPGADLTVGRVIRGCISGGPIVHAGDGFRETASGRVWTICAVVVERQADVIVVSDAGRAA